MLYLQEQDWKVKHKWATVWLLIRADAGGLKGNEWGSLDPALFLAQRGIDPSTRCFTVMKLQPLSKVNGDWRCCSSKVGGGNSRGDDAMSREAAVCDLTGLQLDWTHDSVASYTLTWTGTWEQGSFSRLVCSLGDALEEILGHLTQTQTQFHWNPLLCVISPSCKSRTRPPPEDLLGGNAFVFALCAAPTCAPQHPQRQVVTQQLPYCTSFDSVYTCMPG